MDLSEICEILIYAGFPVGLFLGYRFGKQFINEKLEARILELMNENKILSVKVQKEKGKWLMIDYFIDQDGPVSVYECNVCAFEGTDNSDYCPECGSAMYETEETPEGIRRREMAESEGVIG